MPDPRPTKSARRSIRDENRAAYREAITEAAIRVFGSTGYNDAKIADIAAEAGVATGTLYNYFSSKEEIFQSILEHGRTRLVERLAGLVGDDPLEHLRQLVATILDFLEEGGALFSIYIQLGADSKTFKRADDEADDRFRRELTAEFERTMARAADRLRGDIPADTLATALGGLLHGVIVRWLDGGCRPGLREQADLILDIFLNGAGRRPLDESTGSR